MKKTAESEIIEYIKLVLHWLWLIVLFMIVGIAAGFFLSDFLPKTYTSEAELLVGNFMFSSNPSRDEIQTSEALAQVYAETIETRMLMEDLIATLSLDVTPNELLSQIEITHIRSILTIQSTWDNPETAFDITQAIVQRLTTVEATVNEDDLQRTLLTEQLATLNELLVENNDELSDISRRLNQPGLTIVEEQLLLDRRDVVRTTITDTFLRIGNLRRLQEQFDDTQTSNVLTEVQPPEVPDEPDGISQLYFMALTGILGIFLALGVVVIVNLLDNRIRYSSYITDAMHLPILGEVPRISHRRGLEHVIISNNNVSQKITEAYRFIVARLITMQEAADLEQETYMLTSPKDDGSTTITSVNIAITMANSGYDVLLINIASTRSVQEDYGALELKEAQNNQFYDTCFQRLKVMRIDDVKVREQGSFVFLHQLKEIVERLDRSSIKTIIIDAPSAIEHADAMLTAGILDSQVIAVLDAKNIREEDLNSLRSKFTDLSGVIITNA